MVGSVFRLVATTPPLTAGLSLGASAIVKEQIDGAQPARAHELVLDLSAELVIVDGVHAINRDSRAPPLLLLDSVPPALAAGIRIYLWCQRDGTGRQAKIHAINGPAELAS
ncbi:hypothetical protein [Burkholderia gladioli]|uniref:hypothetical protein n=1 Tax=Burkholderia gladioli TaxID=28095 RepID=UPI00163EA150|nr:hypothetical protein [Burkholderia gladioli]